LGYIGNTPADKYQTLQKQSFITSATTSYTLSYSVTNPQDIALFINNVRQNPNSSYTVSGTTLTLSSATTGTDVMYAVFLGKSVGTIAPAVGSVTNDMLSGSIANAKLTNSSITLNGSAVSLGGSATIGGGKVGQVVQGSLTSVFSTTSSTYGDIGLSASITPVATSSKVLVQAMIPMQVTGGAEADAYVKVLRGATTIHESGSQNFALYAATGAIDLRWVNNFISLDSPSTASAVTYKFQYKTGAAGSTARASFGNTPSYIVLTEVLA